MAHGLRHGKKITLRVLAGSLMLNAALNVTDMAASDAEGSALSPSGDLKRLAVQSLEAHPAFRGQLAGCAVDIESVGNRLVLHGRVPSWYLKQLLQETLRRVEGVAVVENLVVVASAGNHPTKE